MDDVMKQTLFLVLGTTLVLAGCDEIGTAGLDGALPVVPEQVLALAGPNQNLDAVRFGPDDNCYHFRHVGPVETIWLTLRTANGNKICTKPAEEA